MFQISRNTPAYYLTSVTHSRLPIFRTDLIKQIVCNSLDEARQSAGIMIFAYVIMPDHLHLISDSKRNSSDVLRFTNGIIAHRIIQYLKENGYESSLERLRVTDRGRGHMHSVFEHHSNRFEIYGENTMMQKVNYIHFNPIRAELVEHPNDYLYSSARLWNRRAIEDEPFITDHTKIRWRG